MVFVFLFLIFLHYFIFSYPCCALAPVRAAREKSNSGGARTRNCASRVTDANTSLAKEIQKKSTFLINYRLF